MSRSRRNRSRKLPLKALALAGAALLIIGGIGGAAYLATRKSPEDHLRLAAEFMEKGDGKAAAIALKNVLQQQPKNAEARFRLGRVHFEAQEYLAAEKELAQARELGHDLAAVLPLLTRAQLALGKPEKVLAHPLPAEGLAAPVRAELLALRARALMTTGKRPEAEAALAEADKLQDAHPDSLVARAYLALMTRDHGAARSLLDKALAAAPKRDDIWLIKGDLLNATGDKAGALAAYGQVLALNPRDLTARLTTSMLHLEAGRSEAAAAELQKAARVNPGNTMVRYVDALIHFRQGKYTQAQAKMLEVMKSAPDFLPGHLLSGAINLALGNRAAATSHLQRVLAQVPEHAYARKLLAMALIGSGQVEGAQEALAGLRTDNDLLSQTLLADIARRKGDKTTALQHFEQATRLAPDNPQLLTQLARSRAQAGDSEGAAEALSRAAELEHEGHQPELLLIATHLKAKRYAEALQKVDQLEKENPNKPLGPSLRGVVYAAQNDVTQARAQFNRALQLDPGHLASAANLAMLDVQANDLAAARHRFERVIKHNPKESRAWVALAALAARERNEAEYLRLLGQAKASNPKASQPRDLLIQHWVAKGEATKILNEATEALNATGRADYLGVIGKAHLLLKDRGRALQSFNQWAEKSPANPAAHYRLAETYRAEGNSQAAIAAYDRALALQPNYGEALLGKAIAHIKGNQRDNAIQMARAFQKAYPQSPFGYEAEAMALLDQVKNAEAARLFQQAAKHSGLPRHATQAHAALVAAGQGKAADDYLHGWLTQRPEDAQTRHHLAASLLERGDRAAAVRHYETLVKDNARDLVALNNLASLYGDLGDKRGLDTAARALQLAPTNASVLDTYGWLLTQSGKAGDGLAYLRQALQALPNNPEVRWHLAQALHRSGDSKGAAAELDRLLTSRVSFPQEAEARKLLQQLRSGGSG